MRTGPELKPRKRYANDGTFLGILHHAVKKHVPPASEWLQIAQLDAAVKGGGGGASGYADYCRILLPLMAANKCVPYSRGSI